MTSTFRIGLASCVASALLVFPASVGGAQEVVVPENVKGTATISGKVVDERNKSVPNPNVTLILLENNGKIALDGKGNGDFEVKNIKPGAWRLRVETPNYITVRKDVTVADGKNPKMSIASKRDNDPKLVEKADALLQAEQFAEARAEYMKVVGEHPELTGIHRAIAFTYGREKNTAEAFKHVELALAGSPDDTLLLNVAASSAMEAKEYPKAVAYIAKIDDTTVTEPNLFMNFAISLINAKQTADAVTILDRVIARFPEASDSYFYRGYAKMVDTKPEEAKLDFEKYLALAPNGAQAGKAKEILETIKETTK
ncbi:MAG: tetratricopeptide repeat protein [Acidobacteria bacterium]|nr:tetratricopeptide repeat protein [Acidobacteriota bacterium]